jgi:type IV secretory pathway TrbD component
MATGNAVSGLRAGADIARAIPPGSRRLMTILAQRAGTLCGDLATIMQERPALAFGLLTVLLGAALGTWQARLFPRRQTIKHQLRHGRRQFKAALDLAPLVIKLLANPIVQDYLHRRVLREVSRHLGR